MCLSPIYKRNTKKQHYVSEKGKIVEVPNRIVDNSYYSKVPCGKCAECRKRYYNSILQRALVESMSSYMYFITLTYDNEHIPQIEIDGEKYKYANYEHIQDMFKRLRASGKLDREFRYLSVNEYGTENHRPHFHILLFISKKDSDTFNTPREIEQILFDNLKIYYSVNIGTRKNPLYECLFTYKRVIRNGKLNTNYFVKYVTTEEFDNIVNNNDVNQSITYVKTIQYLIGYINKKSRYDNKIELLLNRYKDDIYLHNKYKHLLKSQCRFSKNFGCGFINGKKNELEKISVRASSNVLFYSELVDSLPSTYEEFSDTYEELNEELIEFINSDYYSNHKSMKECLNSMSSDDYMLHCIYLKYFKKEFSEKYNIYKNNVQATISYHYAYTNKDYTYSMEKVTTTNPNINNPIYKYLREGVEDGIRSGIPFLAFKMIGSQSFTSLCKYYRDRVCTIQDTLDIYDRIGVKNYQEWLEKFNEQRKLDSSNIASGNEYKYFNEDIVEEEEVQDFIQDVNVYNMLFSNRKHIRQ